MDPARKVMMKGRILNWTKMIPKMMNNLTVKLKVTQIVQLKRQDKVLLYSIGRDLTVLHKLPTLDKDSN